MGASARALAVRGTWSSRNTALTSVGVLVGEGGCTIFVPAPCSCRHFFYGVFFDVWGCLSSSRWVIRDIRGAGLHGYFRKESFVEDSPHVDEYRSGVEHKI